MSGYELSIEKTRKSEKGARIRCMYDYAKPTLRENPDQIIQQIGTNDLLTEKNPMKLPEMFRNYL